MVEKIWMVIDKWLVTKIWKLNQILNANVCVLNRPALQPLLITLGQLSFNPHLEWFKIMNKNPSACFPSQNNSQTLRREREREMGNWMGKSRAVHPIEGHEGLRSSRSLRIKVVMTRTQLKQLMAMAAQLRMSDDLGSFIFQQCCQAKLDARLLTCTYLND